jgi:hypothetical protein
MISCRLKLTSLAYKIDPIQFNFSNISLDTWLVLRENGLYSGESYYSSGELIHFRLELSQFSGKTVCFPENRSILPGNFKFSRRIISFLRRIDPFPNGNESVLRENSLFPGESNHFSGKLSYFPENNISFPGKRSVANGNYLIPVGNRFISRRIISFLREISLFPGESYRFPGKIKLFYIETIICYFDPLRFP